jgi:hypothetical protein
MLISDTAAILLHRLSKGDPEAVEVANDELAPVIANMKHGKYVL